MDQSRKTDGNPLIFYRSPPTLQAFASDRIAFELWRNRIHSIKDKSLKKYYENTECIDETWLENQKFDIPSLGVPTLICGVIGKSINKLIYRIENWAQAHRYGMFDIYEIYNVYRHHEAIIRFIDYLDTDDDKIIARKLLDSNELNSKEKYRLACQYCWEDDIKRLWPRVSHKARIIDVEPDDGLEMIYYWNCQMMGIAPTGIFEHENEEESLEFSMLQYLDYVIEWAVVDYFWDKMNAEDRSAILSDLLLSSNSETLISLLPKLSKLQVNGLISEIAESIVDKLAMEVEYYDYVMKIWAYLCKIGTNNKLSNAFITGWQIYNCRFGDMPAHKCFQASAVVYELWICAPAKLRRYFLSRNRVEQLFNKLRPLQPSENFTPKRYIWDMNFMLEILKTKKLSKRNKIWRKNWRKIIIRTDPSRLEEFMKLCFKNEDEIILFKECVMMNYDELELEFEKFLKSGFCLEIFHYVKFCSSNPQRVENLLRRILSLSLRNGIDLSSFHNRIDLSSLHNGIDLENFRTILSYTFLDQKFAMRFQAEYVLASENPVLRCVLNELDKGCFNWPISFCNSLNFKLCPNEVKREFLQWCRDYLNSLTFFEFKISIWRYFVTSCAGSEENVNVFKQSILVDEIFFGLLDRIIERKLKNKHHFEPFLSYMREPESIDYADNRMEIFIIIDNFLMWYFGSVKGVEEYKADKFDPAVIQWIVETLAPKKEDEALNVLLEWIYEYDILKVEKFKKNYIPREVN